MITQAASSILTKLINATRTDNFITFRLLWKKNNPKSYFYNYEVLSERLKEKKKPVVIVGFLENLVRA